MMILSVILWALALGWLVSSVRPTYDLPQDVIGNSAYLLLWLILVGAAAAVEYLVMAHLQHARLGIVGDVSGFVLGLVRLIMTGRRHVREENV